jgi:hypothetical protein
MRTLRRGQSILSASTVNGQTFNASVQYIDPSLDLALIKLEGSNFAYLPVADLSTIQAGSKYRQNCELGMGPIFLSLVVEGGSGGVCCDLAKRYKSC